MNLAAGFGLIGTALMCIGLCTGCTFLTCFGGTVMVVSLVVTMLSRDEE